MRGFALPVLLPETRSLPWDAIVALRSDKRLTRLRSVLLDLESATLEEVRHGADLEETLHRLYDRRMRAELTALDTLDVGTATVLSGFVVGVGSTVASLGVVGPAALAIGVGAAALAAGGDIVRIRRFRRNHSWVQALDRIELLATS
jgi:hypothetical protein